MSLNAYKHVATYPAPGAPLVFAFHGTGGDEHQFTGLIEQILPNAGVVSPRGDVSEHGANRFFRRTGEGVYDMADLAARTAKMRGFIRAHREANDGAPVFGLGYSNGANILASVQPALNRDPPSASKRDPGEFQCEAQHRRSRGASVSRRDRTRLSGERCPVKF